jgi:hypothetical protein
MASFLFSLTQLWALRWWIKCCDLAGKEVALQAIFDRLSLTLTSQVCCPSPSFYFSPHVQDLLFISTGKRSVRTQFCLFDWLRAVFIILESVVTLLYTASRVIEKLVEIFKNSLLFCSGWLLYRVNIALIQFWALGLIPLTFSIKLSHCCHDLCLCRRITMKWDRPTFYLVRRS